MPRPIPPVATGRSVAMRGGAVVAAAVFVLFACGDPDDYDRREDMTTEIIACEEAYARLESCCPGFAIPTAETGDGVCVDRDFRKKSPHGCDSGYTLRTFEQRPAIGRSESACVREASCQVLRDSGVCTRARTAKARIEGSSYTSDPYHLRGESSSGSFGQNHPPICP